MKVVIYGNGVLAQTLYAMIAEEGIYQVAAFTANEQYIKDKQFLGLPLVPFETVEEKYPPDKFDLLVLIGYSKMRDRKMMFDQAKDKGYRLPGYKSKNAIIYDSAVIGENNFICENVYIGPFCQLGQNNIFRPQTYIGHHSIIGDHCFIAPGVNISGFCQIQNLSFIGVGSTIIDHVTIGTETLVAAGTTLWKNTEPYSQYAGYPPTKVGEHKETGILFVRS